MSNEKPILFKDDMIRAILEGRKTQTRRVMKVQPPTDNHQLLTIMSSTDRSKEGKSHWAILNDEKTSVIDGHNQFFSCPYGQPGDRLWVRENFLQLMHGQVTDGRMKYCASIDPRSTGTPKNDGYWWRKRPSIHMPRWASRITLEITDVRVERLQDITEEAAQAEGARPSFLIPNSRKVSRSPQYRWGFHQLWESIYGQNSWDANPLVWVIEFKRIDQEAKAA